MKLELDRITEIEDSLNRKSIRPESPRDPWHQSIVYESFNLFWFAKDELSNFENILMDFVQSKEEGDYRAVNFGSPIKYGSGVVRMANSIDDVFNTLMIYENRLEFCRSRSTFVNDHFYDIMARKHLKNSDRLIEISRLSFHSHIWLAWALEGLSQTNRIAGMVIKGGFQESSTSRTAAILAHPPLSVSVLSCSSAIEEVGCTFLNRLTDGQQDPSSTSARVILRKLEKYMEEVDAFDLELIEDEIIDRRIDISHYLSKRDDLINADQFDFLFDGVVEAIQLIRHMLAKLQNNIIVDYLVLLQFYNIEAEVGFEEIYSYVRGSVQEQSSENSSKTGP